MPFTRRQVYAGNGNLRRARKDEATRVDPSAINPDREKWVAAAYEDAVKAVLATPHLQYKHLVRLLEDPRFGPREVLDKFPWPLFEEKFREAESMIVDQLHNGAEQGVGELFGDFRRKDPQVLIWGATHAAQMVTNISENQRRLLRNHVMNSHLSGIPVRQLAVEIRSLVGLHPQWQKAVVNFHRALLAKEADEKFAAKQTAKYAQRLVIARAKMIARTEVMKAENEGKIMGWKAAISQGLLSPGGKVRWQTAITNVCPICLPMDGVETDLDSTFRVSDTTGKSWDVRTPPSHPNCRCTIIYVPPTVEQLADDLGVDLQSLMDEITTGTYTPDPEPEPEPEPEPAPLALLPPDPLAIPDPPFFTRRGQAQEWADKHMTATSRTVSEATFLPPLAADEQAYREWVVERARQDYGPDYMVSDWDLGNPAMRRLYSEQFPDSRHVPRYDRREVPVKRMVNLEDLSIDAINPFLRQMVRLSRENPETWDRTMRIGTLQAIYRDDPAYPNQVGGNTYAQATRNGANLAYTLGLNKVWFSTRGLPRYIKTFNNDVATGHHPLSDLDEISSSVIHEQGHLIHYFISDLPNFNWGDSLGEALEAATGIPRSQWKLDNPVVQNLITTQLSRYALESWWEFVAEAWVGYKTHPQPTLLMKVVGEWMVQHGR